MNASFFVLARRCTVALALALPSVGVANSLEETLQFYLAKSDVVVLGEFAAEPIRRGASKFGTDYLADFNIAQVIKWDAPGDTKAGAVIKVHIVRTVLHEDDFEPEDLVPDLKKGGKGILFLNCYLEKPTPSYITADIWFGVQRPSSWMAKSLARIVADQAKSPLRLPAEKEIEQISADRVGRVDTSKDFKLDEAGLLKILREYHVLSKQQWLQIPHYFEERTGTIRLHDGTRIEYLIYPAGLGTLTFPDGRKLYLSREGAIKFD